MKKKILVAVSAIVAVSAGLCTYLNSANKTDDLFRANVEALSDQESGGFGPMCSKTCTPGKHYMVSCNNCNGLPNYYAMDVVAFCQN